MRKKKFTLVEMLCVVAIIAILCGIIFGASGAIRSRNAEIKTRAMLKEIEIALEECKQKFGYYPKDSAGSYSASSDLNFYVKQLYLGNSAPDKLNDSYYNDKYFKEFIKSCNFTSFEIKEVNSKDCICDAYGVPLQYKSNGKSYVLYSCGRDGKAVLDLSGDLVETEDTEHENFDNIYLD